MYTNVSIFIKTINELINTCKILKIVSGIY